MVVIYHDFRTKHFNSSVKDFFSSFLFILLLGFLDRYGCLGTTSILTGQSGIFTSKNQKTTQTRLWVRLQVFRFLDSYINLSLEKTPSLISKSSYTLRLQALGPEISRIDKMHIRCGPLDWHLDELEITEPRALIDGTRRLIYSESSFGLTKNYPIASTDLDLLVESMINSVTSTVTLYQNNQTKPSILTYVLTNSDKQLLNQFL